MDPEPADSEAEVPLREYQGGTITLKTDTAEDYATQLLPKLESFMQQAHAAVGRILGEKTAPQRITIIVFETQERYKEYAGKYASGLVNNGGYYNGGMRTVVTYRLNNSMQQCFHELVHAMMGELFSDRHFTRYLQHNWPIWFDEGISEYLASYDLVGQRISIPAPNKSKLAYLANAAADNAFIDLPTLLRAPAWKFSGESMNLYYASSWGLINFLVSSPEYSASVPGFFRRIRQGEDGVVAFKQSFGNDLAAFDTSWRTYIAQMAQPASDWVSLFNRESIDNWSIHDGGQWKAGGGVISVTGDRGYNYLIKHEIPMTDLTYALDLQLTRGTAGLVLGNESQSQYLYHYLINVTDDTVIVRQASAADKITCVAKALAKVPLGKWVQLRVQIINHTLTLSVDDAKVLSMPVDGKRFSLFGLYIFEGQAQFRNIQVRREDSNRQPY